MRNQGEIVSLIVFIVLTLVLGVTTYFGFKSMSEQKAERQTAQSELDNVKSETERLATEYSAFKAKLGYEDGISAADIAQQMKRDVATALAKTADEALVGARQGKYDKDDEEAGAAPVSEKTFKDALAELKTNLASLAKDVSDAQTNRDAQIQNALASIQTSEKNRDDFDSAVATEQNEQSQKLENARDDYNKLTTLFADQTKRFDAVKVEANEAIRDATRETATYAEAATKFAEINMDLSKRIDELSSTDFDTPDATVVYADQVARTVRLDIGKKDGVRPLMKFNVYPYDFLTFGGGSAKGEIQVVRTMEDGACEAKILSDDDSDPIRPGDLVYTSLWKPGEVEQYALDYRLDVNGDGVSDLQEIVNLIESNGMKVAAWIDAQGVVHGKITPEVTRLVISSRPVVDVLAGDDSLSDEQKEQIQTAVANFREQAKANGVREMRLNDFLVRLDYKGVDEIYNTGELKNVLESNIVGSTPTAPLIFSNTGETASQGVPTVRPAQPKSVDSVDTYFRKRSPK